MLHFVWRNMIFEGFFFGGGRGGMIIGSFSSPYITILPKKCYLIKLNISMDNETFLTIWVKIIFDGGGDFL